VKVVIILKPIDKTFVCRSAQKVANILYRFGIPVGQIAEKAVCMSVLLTIWQ